MGLNILNTGTLRNVSFKERIYVKALKSRKTDTKYNKSLTFLLNVTFNYFYYLLKECYCQLNTIRNLHEEE